MNLICSLAVVISLALSIFWTVKFVLALIKKQPKKKPLTYWAISFVLMCVFALMVPQDESTPSTPNSSSVPAVSSSSAAEEPASAPASSEESEPTASSASSDSLSTAQEPVGETNLLMNTNISERPVMNGFKTERIGTYGLVMMDKDFLKAYGEEKFVEYVNTVVAGKDYNWFTIDFGDGTGLVFTGCNTLVITYAELDEENAIAETIGTAILNEDGGYTYTQS